MKNRKKFSAIVPVAGVGTRLRPHTTTYPKVLLTVGDKPILGHILDQLEEIKTDRIYLITGYLGDKIREYVGKNIPTSTRCSWNRKKCWAWGTQYGRPPDRLKDLRSFY